MYCKIEKLFPIRYASLKFDSEPGIIASIYKKLGTIQSLVYMRNTGF